MLRGGLTAALVVTVFASVANFGLAKMWGWVDYDLLKGTVQRGVPQWEGRSKLSPQEFEDKLRENRGFVWDGCSSGQGYGSALFAEVVIRRSELDECDFSKAVSPWLLMEGGSARKTDFRDAELSFAVFAQGAGDLPGRGVSDGRRRLRISPDRCGPGRVRRSRPLDWWGLDRLPTGRVE
jgi:hypothetical protein